MMRAFQVNDHENRSAIVFAKHPVVARKRGANELDTDFEGVSSCRRKPEFDQYAERGFVPIEVLIDSGWWYECSGCSQVVTSDHEGDDGEPLSPVYTDHDVWCTPECKASHDRSNRIRKRIDALAASAVRRMLSKRYPEAIATNVHVYSRGMKIVQAMAYFDFPGSKYGATIRFRCESSGATRGNPALSVANGDLEAWKEYSAGRIAAKEAEAAA